MISNRRRCGQDLDFIMLSSPYFQHALYSVACLSISMNIVGMRRAAEEDKARIDARLSILQSLKEHLTKDDSDDNPQQYKEELERLMKLAQKSAIRQTDIVREERDVSWRDIFTGKTPRSAGGEALSRWEKEELETGA